MSPGTTPKKPKKNAKQQQQQLKLGVTVVERMRVLTTHPCGGVTSIARPAMTARVLVMCLTETGSETVALGAHVAIDLRHLPETTEIAVEGAIRREMIGRTSMTTNAADLGVLRAGDSTRGHLGGVARPQDEDVVGEVIGTERCNSPMHLCSA